jgi:hypothetical protein
MVILQQKSSIKRKNKGKKIDKKELQNKIKNFHLGRTNQKRVNRQNNTCLMITKNAETVLTILAKVTREKVDIRSTEIKTEKILVHAKNLTKLKLSAKLESNLTLKNQLSKTAKRRMMKNL